MYCFKILVLHLTEYRIEILLLSPLAATKSVHNVEENDCRKYTDDSGIKLGANQCCGVNILDQAEFCAANEQNAPCKIQFTENDVLDHLYDAIYMMG